MEGERIDDMQYEEGSTLWKENELRIGNIRKEASYGR